MVCLSVWVDAVTLCAVSFWAGCVCNTQCLDRDQVCQPSYPHLSHYNAAEGLNSNL